MEKLLPHNIEAEQGVLGSILIDADTASLVSDFLLPEDFYRDAHRSIYQVIQQLVDERTPADFITLCDVLERSSTLDSVGGAAYIASLINQVPTSGNIEYYGRIVERTATCRRLIHAAGRIVADAYAGDEDALPHAEDLILAIRKRGSHAGFASGSAILAEYFPKLERLHDTPGSVIGVPTGFHSLDRTLGGMQKSDLLIAAGRPAMGKTALMLNIAYNTMLNYGNRVAIFSLEMSREQLMQRLISMDTGIDSQLLRNGKFHEDDWEAVTASLGRLSTDLLQIDDTGGLKVTEMRSKARRLHAECPIDLVIVDYLQLMQAHSNGKRIEPRLQELAEITAGLKALAKELNVPVLALAQLSRAVENRQSKIPQLSDLRESGTIENDADVVMFIYRDDYYQQQSPRPHTADVIVEKHRNGPTGETELYFSGRHTRFFNTRGEWQLWQ